MGFRSVYKRHTPFAMSLYEQVVQGSRKIVFDKTGDVLLYTYLYREDGTDWTNLQSVEFHIGGTKILDWEVNYLCGPYPLLSEQADSKTHTDASSLFLPLPIPPMLPVKTITHHEIELVLQWKYEPFKVRCFTMYAFVDEELPSNTDILIHQVKKVQVVDGHPMKLYGPVKYLVSDGLDQPTKMILDGQDVHVQDDTVYTYYHSRFDRLDFKDSRRYAYADIGLYNVRTAQRIGDFIYIFSSTSPIVKVYDTRRYFGDHAAYRDINTGVDDVWSSCTDGTNVYAASINGKIVKVGQGEFFTAPHNVYALYHYRGVFIAVGNDYISYFKDGVVTTRFLGNTGTYDGSFQLTGSQDFGDAIVMFRNDGTTGILVVDQLNFTTQEYQFLTITDVYDQYSSSFTINGSTYITSGFGDVFTRQYLNFTQEYLLDTNQYYTTMVYDGSKYLYLYGENTVVRFDASKDRYNMFIPFCTDAQSTDPSGSLNFDSIQNVLFRGCGNGYMYSVGYNILRVSNGITGLLYS